MRRTWKLLTTRFATVLDRWQPPETAILLIMALIVGFGAGYGAVGFRMLINFINNLAFVEGRTALHFVGDYYVILLPAIGGLFVGPLVYFLAREAKGHGVPEVMEAVAMRAGRIRPIVVIVKALASSITIGTGGSVGREGPIVQIGSALGSSIGQALRMSNSRIQTLVACGAAGGIAATFNAPIAGAIFALEVIIGDFAVSNFASVVVSAVAAGAIGRIVLGNEPAFIIPRYDLASPWELLLYALLGMLTATVAVAFVRVLYRVEDIFDAWKFPEYLKPIPGGLIVGAMGFFFPQLFGVGYDAISSTLRGEGTWSLLLALVVLKMLATSITIGSGGSGGVFAPSLFLGAMVGGLFGLGMNQVFPTITAPAGAYAVVGMAALFSGAAHAPLTAIIIVFEMTNDYRLILPLMLTTVISTILAEVLNKESIYTMKLVRRGIRLERGRDIDVMQGVFVGEAMTRDITPVPASMTLAELAREFERSHHHGLPVVDESGDLYGLVTIRDLERALSNPEIDRMTVPVSEIATTHPVVTYPDEPMWSALKKLGTRGFGRLPVVDRNNPRRLVGMLRRDDVIQAYNTGIVRRLEAQQAAERLKLGKLSPATYTDIVVERGSEADGRPLRELQLPQSCLIVALQRGRETIIAHGNTVLQAGDRVTAFLGSPDCQADLRSRLEKRADREEEIGQAAAQGET